MHLSSISSQQEIDRGAGRVDPQCGSQEPSCKNIAGCVSLQSEFLQSHTLDSAGIRMKHVSFSKLLQKESCRNLPATEKEVFQRD